MCSLVLPKTRGDALQASRALPRCCFCFPVSVLHIPAASSSLDSVLCSRRGDHCLLLGSSLPGQRPGKCLRAKYHRTHLTYSPPLRNHRRDLPFVQVLHTFCPIFWYFVMEEGSLTSTAPQLKQMSVIVYKTHVLRLCNGSTDGTLGNDTLFERALKNKD